MNGFGLHHNLKLRFSKSSEEARLITPRIHQQNKRLLNAGRRLFTNVTRPLPTR